MRSRLLVTLACLAAGLVAADLLVGRWLIENGTYRGRRLPPFADFTAPAQVRWLERELAMAESGREPPVLGCFDPELGWTNRAGIAWGKPPHFFNSLGARGRREYPPRPEEESFRLVCFGESFVYGTEVEFREDWAGQLETIDRRLEVINFGVGGYGTDQSLLRFRRKGRELGAHVAILGITFQNILRDVNRLRVLNHPAHRRPSVKPRFVLRDDGALELVPIPFATWAEVLHAARDEALVDALAEHEHWSDARPWIPGSTLARFLAARRAYDARRAEDLWRDPAGEPFRTTLALIETFCREAAEAGIDHAAVFVFPTTRDLEAHDRVGPFWEPLIDALEARGIAHVDFTELLLPAARERELYRELHLNPAGNRLVAEHVYAWIRSDLGLPPP